MADREQARKQQLIDAGKGQAAEAQRQRRQESVVAARTRPARAQKQSASPVPKPQPEDPAVKQFFQVIIDDLNERLNRARETAEAYRDNNEYLTKRLEQEMRDRKDEVDLHKRESKEIESRFEDQKRKTAEVRLQYDQLQKKYDEDMLTQQRILQLKQTESQVETEQLREELSELQEFKRDKDSLMKKTHGLEKQIEEERERHRKEMHQTEHKLTLEKERLRRELQDKFKELHTSVLKITADQVKTTTKHTIEENDRLINELAYHAMQTQELVNLNDKLISDNRKLKLEVDLLKQEEDEMAKRSHATTKLFKSMAAKFKSAEQTMKSEHGREDRHLDSRLATLREQVETYELALNEAEARDAQQRQDISTARTEAGMLKEKLDKQVSLHNEVAHFMFAFLEDMRGMLGKDRKPTDSRIADDAAAALEEQLNIAERERIMQYLIAKLSSLPMQARISAADDVNIPIDVLTVTDDVDQMHAGPSPQPFVQKPQKPTVSIPKSLSQEMAVQTAPRAAPQPYKSSTAKGIQPGEIALHPVVSPVRPWGKKAETVPLKVTFLPKGKPGQR